jgi:formyltetrahydrofolate hydrolase
MLLKETEFKNSVFLDCLTTQKQEKLSLEIFIILRNYFSRNGVASQEDSSFTKTTVIISNLVEKDFFSLCENNPQDQNVIAHVFTLLSENFPPLNPLNKIIDLIMQITYF